MILHRIWHRLFGSKQEETSFYILMSFLITFVVARLIVYLIVEDYLPDIFLTIKGVHIHHLSYGIFLLVWVGFYCLVYANTAQKLYKTAIVYGIGLGLTFDEFGMWLRLRDDYWIRQSYDAIIVISLLLINFVYLRHFWARLIRFFARR